MVRQQRFDSAAAVVTWTLIGVVALQIGWLLLDHEAPRWLPGQWGGALLLVGGTATAGLLARAARRRRGHLSPARFANELSSMRYWVRRRDWDGLEAHFRQFAARSCGPARAAAAAAVDLTSYRAALADGLRAAYEAAAPLQGAVIIYLHRPDERWSGAFCVYRRATPDTAAPPRRMDACVAEVSGPASEAMAAVFRGQRDPHNAVVLLLVARTVVALGRCSEDISPGGHALCMAVEGDGGLLWLRDHGHTRPTSIQP